MLETRGLCLSEEQTVTSILKRPRMDLRGLVGIRTQPQKLVRRCEVTAILVLYGLPRLLTGAILAHELMHGWLCLNDYRKEPQIVGRRRHLSGALPHVARIRGHPGVQEHAIHICSRVVVIVIDMVLWFKHPIIAVFFFFRIPLAAASNIQERLEVERKLGEFFMHQITHDASLAYGGGFRSAMAAVNKYGLRRTLDHIQYTGTFPE